MLRSVDEDATLPPPPRSSELETVAPQEAESDTDTEAPRRRGGGRARRQGAALLERGDALGRYVILERLGAGGMGVVYAAYDPELDRKLAIKLLHRRESQLEHTDGQARLLAEARAMARLSHPNVIPVFDAVSFGEQVAVVMEHIEGESLDAWLKREATAIETRQIVDTFIAAGRGLVAAHEAGIIHRDFKPENVMLGIDGRVRVMDFGLAHSETHELAADTAGLEIRASIDPDADKLTMTGAVMGTPAFMSPEQFAGDPTDARTDQFSFCVSLWQALYGERPFAGSTFAELTYAVTKGNRREPPAGARKVGARIRHALERGLSTDRNQRFPSMESLLADLEPRRGTAWAVAAVLGVAAIAGPVIVSASHQDPVATPPPACLDAAAPLIPVWGPERSGALTEAFSRSGLEYQAEVASRVTARLEAYAARWSALRKESCEATLVRREMTESLHDRQVSCLDGRLRELRAVTGVLVDADASVVDRAVQVVGSLPSIESCADVEYITSQLPIPDDPARREAVDDALEHLAVTRALEVAGRYADATATMTELRERAEALDYDPLTAEVATRLGSLLDYQGDYPEAELQLELGFFAAQRSGAAPTAAALGAKLTHVVGDHLERHEEALRWSRHAEAAVDAGGLDDGLRARVLNNRGNIVFRQDRHEDALALFVEGLQLREREHGAEHPDVAMSLANLARALEVAGRHDEAISTQEEAVSRCGRSLNEAHPQCAWSNVILAKLSAAGESGLAEEGRALVEGALPILVAAHGEDHARVRSARSLLAAP
jgi:tRNA A-37 threonylcarbamoyl transferase component Bud32/tetratricopeptide (TPR) repeat protein